MRSFWLGVLRIGWLVPPMAACVLVALCSCGRQPQSEVAGSAPAVATDSGTAPAWVEPEWDAESKEQLLLKLQPAQEALWRYSYHVRERIARGDGKAPSDCFTAFTHDWSFRRTGDTGPWVVLLREVLDASTLPAEPGASFIPTWGRFDLADSGAMTGVAGCVPLRSLPSFPSEAVGIGSAWQAPVQCAVSWNTPRAEAVGSCTYQITGLAEVDGHRWVQIGVEFSAKMPPAPQEFQRVAGVQLPDDPSGPATVEGVPAEYPAHAAGIQVADVIAKVGDCPVRSGRDVFYGVAYAPSGEPVKVELSRGGRAIVLTLRPKVGLSGMLEATVAGRGRIVFDATAGRTVRIELPELVLTSVASAGGKQETQKREADAVIQLMPTPR